MRRRETLSYVCRFSDKKTGPRFDGNDLQLSIQQMTELSLAPRGIRDVKRPLAEQPPGFYGGLG